MSRATPEVRALADRLVKLESQAKTNPDEHQPAGFYACERLRPLLSPTMGSSAFRALLLRSLALSAAEVEWLRAVGIDAQGSFEQLEDMGKQVTDRETAEGGAMVLSQLLGLLMAFIGEDLTLRLVRDAWPDLLPGETDFRKGTRK